ncbi:MAG: pyridoxal-phosphate dependent enzyme [Actinophytocola sp.]|nr:pyridoxal-phosphate dependent enzyme [Actinophytocola sp.]
MDMVTLDDIRAAAIRIAPVALRTPLLSQPWFTERELWLKPENLQHIGAFKIRGAYNAIAALDDGARARGVVAYSSGNHANAVARAAKEFGIPATIVMQESTPRVKVEATAAHGAEIIEVPMAEREAVAHEIAERRGLALVPPFDHPDVIAGQGTIGLEIATDMPEVGVVLVPVAGGGLASGIGVAMKALCPDARVFAVEPELAADTAAGLLAGHRVHWPAEQRARTIADGLRTEPSELTFAHLREVIDGVITVSEEEIRASMRLLATRARLVAEPSGAVSAAAAFFHGGELPAGRTVAVISGGNVDPALLAEVLVSTPRAGVAGA